MRRVAGAIGWSTVWLALVLAACVPPPPRSPEKREETEMQQAKNAFEEGEMAEALRILEKLAHAGDPEAQLLTARIYQLDRGGVPRNDEKAAAWFERAANQGVALAQLRLAEMLEVGDGRPANIRLAFIWVSRAEQSGMPGVPEAANRMGAHLSPNEIVAALLEALNWAPRDERTGRLGSNVGGEPGVNRPGTGGGEKITF